MEKPNFRKSIKGGDAEKPKAVTAAVLGVPSSHGMKLSLNMTSHDKKELLCKLEEWRKVRREKLANSILSKQKQVEKSKGFPVLPLKVRPSGIGTFLVDTSGKKPQEKETVFERLYKNSKKKQETEFKVPQFIRQTVKNKELRVSILEKKSNVDEKSVEDSNHSTKSSIGSSVSCSFENIDFGFQNESFQDSEASEKLQSLSETKEVSEALQEVSNQETLEEQKESLAEGEKLEVSQEKAVHNETFSQESASIFVRESEQKESLAEREKSEISQEKAVHDETFSQESASSFVHESEQKESLAEREKSEISQEKAVHDETFSQESASIFVRESEQKEREVITNQVNDELVKTQLLNSVEKTETAGDCTEIKENGETQTEVVLEKYYEVAGKNKNDVDAKPLKKKNISSEKPKLEKYKSNTDRSRGRMSSKVPVKVNVKGKPENTLRRSISMLYRKKCKPDPAIHRTFSEKNLQELKLENEKKAFKRVQILSPAIEKEEEAKYKTPVKSIGFVTPRNSKFLTSTNLRNKLEDWLKMNGHSLEGYRHLRCFGIAHHAKPEARPLVTPVDTRGSETPPQSPPGDDDDSDKENETPPTAIKQIDVTDVGNWLKELYRLIVELKYPVERCEEWLAAIRRKCATCAQMPVYWECMAALDESKGDVQSAIEHYERAIIKGKDINSVGDSLAQLFDKMVIDQKKPSKFKLEKGMDPKNIFKSTVIKFALQQKALKESGSKTQQHSFVATPVRRSSRIQTPYKPHVVSSLQRLTPDIKKNLTFKANESLMNEK